MVFKYTLQLKLATSDLFTDNKFNQYWWWRPTKPQNICSKVRFVIRLNSKIFMLKNAVKFAAIQLEILSFLNTTII